MAQRCLSKNARGEHCAAWAVTGRKLCALHSDPKRAAELGSKHGRRLMAQANADLLGPALRRLKSPADVCDLLEETMNRVLQGSLDHRSANTIGFLAGIHLKALAQNEIPDIPNSETSGGIYTSLFQRMAKSNPESPTSLAELPFLDQSEVSDLYPETARPVLSPMKASHLPAAGEVTDEPSDKSRTSGVITVEVG
jgi:hypothetical protein